MFQYALGTGTLPTEVEKPTDTDRSEDSGFAFSQIYCDLLARAELQNLRGANFMTPVFIGGCERSGTTFLASLLGAHERCLTTPAAQFLTDTMQGFAEAPIDRNIGKIRERIARHSQFLKWETTLPELTEKDQLSEWYSKLFQSYAASRKPDAHYWINHSPANIRHVPSLLRQFSDARFIHIVRDGRAVAASVRKLPWRMGTMKTLALFWAERLSHGLAAESALGSSCVLRVSYETLLTDTEAELRKVATFVGIPYCEQMARGGGFKVAERGGHELVGEPPVKGRLDGWRDELAKREIELFEFYSAELLELLGYVPDYGRAARPPSLSEKIFMAIEARRKLVHDVVIQKFKQTNI